MGGSQMKAVSSEALRLALTPVAWRGGLTSTRVSHRPAGEPRGAPWLLMRAEGRQGEAGGGGRAGPAAPSLPPASSLVAFEWRFNVLLT